jgi:hypothetical protein
MILVAASVDPTDARSVSVRTEAVPFVVEM